ncbi:MAG: V-type ATP synthase subunit E [Halobacteriaceae archaeon]
MSLETVVEDIRNEAKERRKEILEEAEQEANEILEEAKKDAAETLASAEEEVSEEIEQEREQRLSSAKLEAKQMRLEARRDALDEVKEAIEERIAALEGDERRELTQELIETASDEFDEEAIVYGREEDTELLQSILTDYDDLSYGGTRECLGGVIVEGEQSRVRINNTFDSILEEVWEDNLKDVSDILFDNQ